MENRKFPKEYTHGRLPEMAPLANPYVPFQLDNPPMYEPAKGLIRGTVYPGLDLPFRGMVNQKELPVTPKTNMQVLSFSLQELAIYLDTHPDDREALELYRRYQQMYQEAMQKYSEKCAPMTHMNPVDHNTYTWMSDPWPWEYSANKEG